MATFLFQLIKSLLLPPGILLLVLLLSLVNRRWLSVLLATCLLYLLSTPFIAAQINRGLETYPVLTEQQVLNSRAQAIVVLSGGRRTAAPEYGGDTVGDATLARLRYAARLHRFSRLPVIVSGGSPYREEAIGEAELARPVLAQEFGVKPLLIEANSPNTRENARLTKRLLQQQGISRILLVTHAWHMPRAMWSFSGDRLVITPAPTGFYSRSALSLQPGYRQWLPDAKALLQSQRAMHEYLGSIWYLLMQISGQGGPEKKT